MRALSIRQPYAELILRGMKTIEYRSQATRLIGERFYLYASKAKVTPTVSGGIWSSDLDVAAPPPWMMELSKALKLFGDDLPRGVIVGTAIISHVTEGTGSSAGYFHWHLDQVERLKTPRRPTRHPQPVWFVPFAA